MLKYNIMNRGTLLTVIKLKAKCNVQAVGMLLYILARNKHKSCIIFKELVNSKNCGLFKFSTAHFRRLNGCHSGIIDGSNAIRMYKGGMVANCMIFIRFCENAVTCMSDYRWGLDW
jgi:hypothetical protein